MLHLPPCITALVTPFHTAEPIDNALDVTALQALLMRQREGGVRGVVLAGSTGEGQMLTPAEQQSLWREGVEAFGGEDRIVLAGTGGFSTQQTIVSTQQAADCGVDAALVVTPPYVRPTQEGLYAHFMRIADASPIPLMLYNVPTRTSVDLLPQTTAKLAAHERIAGIKDAVPSLERAQALLTIRDQQPSGGFRIYSGDDNSAAAWVARGADGVVSVASNLAPQGMQQLVTSAADATVSADDSVDLQPLLQWLGSVPNPSGVKAWLAQRGIICGHIRLPLQLHPSDNAMAACMNRYHAF